MSCQFLALELFEYAFNGHLRWQVKAFTVEFDKGHFLFLVMFQNRLGLAFIYSDSVFDHLRRVIRPLIELSAAFVADSFDFGFQEAYVVDFAAVFAYSAT